MAKKSKKAPVTTVVTLTHQQVTTVSKAFAEAYTASATAGRYAVVQLAAELQKTLKGESSIAPENVDAIAAYVARARGWKGRTLASRKSELNALLKSYTSIGKAADALVKKTGACNFHNIVSMARNIAKGKTIEQAVNLTKKGGGGAKIKTAEQAEKRVASAIRKLLALPHLPRTVRSALNNVGELVA